MKKQLYEQPLAEIFELHLSANVLQNVSDPSQQGIPQIIGDDVINDDEGYNG